MLIGCPECGHMVSEKAQICINCGYPITNTEKREKSVKSNYTRIRNRRKRLPNGFGSIKRLTGRRSNPYISISSSKCIVGYSETYNDAYKLLCKWNEENHEASGRNITFSQVYKMWFDAKYNDPLSTFSEGSKKNANWAYSKCAELHDVKVGEIGLRDMQKIIDDNANLTKPSINNLLMVLKGVSKYAFNNNMTSVDRSIGIVIKQCKKTEKGEPFTEEEIKKLWDNCDDKDVQKILIYIYSGMRLTELKVTQIDIENRVFSGGIKTSSGKNRVIPIHHRIFEFVKNFGQDAFEQNYWRDKKFVRVLKGIGINEMTEKGNRRTPHDCRHTFSWLCDKYDVESVAKHMLMGHSLGRDVEVNTYGHRTIDELRNEIEKIV